MANITIGFGIGLMALGIGGYAATGGVSLTALIPAFFGVLLLLLGVLARNERYRKHSMHLAVVVAVVGFLGSVGGIRGLFTLLAGGDVARPAAAVSQGLMAIAMAVFIGLSVKSFIDARRARQRVT